jgi:AcrR family transcriptional regulator
MDGRRQRGQRTREAIASQAAAIASVEGLSGMSLAQISTALGIPKSSIQVAYGTKEDLQLATVESATKLFVNSVVAPALAQPEGLRRLVALVDTWIAYISVRVLPGGCFMGATLAEFDSRPGPVRDSLAEARQQWLSLLEHQAAKAQAAGDIPSTPNAAMLAFEIDALLAAANVARNLYDDVSALDMARTLIRLRLEPVNPDVVNVGGAKADARPTRTLKDRPGVRAKQK